MEFIREDCIYARQSVDRKDSISIESQIDFCKYELKGGSCRVFKDKGYSGKNTDRPEFQKLLGEIRKGKVRRVIVYKLDRISRSILDFATMMELFQEYDVEFISSTEKFDTSTPMGRAMLNICIVFAQLERETIQKRVTDAYYSRCLKGFHMSGQAPYELLSLTALCGEFPCDSAARFIDSESYRKKIVTGLTHNRLLRIFSRNHLRGYRLGIRGKRLLQDQEPERFLFYLSGCGDTNAIKSEPSRRLRLHRIARTYITMKNAGITIFRDEKPPLFSPDTAGAIPIEDVYFYDSREMKELRSEMLKIYGSRMTGALFTPKQAFAVFNAMDSIPTFDPQIERRAKVMLQRVCQIRTVATRKVDGILLADHWQTLYILLENTKSSEKEYFLFGEGYEHFYFITNDYYGEALLWMLCNPDATKQFHALLLQSFCPSPKDSAIENDAVTEDGTLILFAYQPDLPKLYRFYAALELHKRSGIIVCFDFQEDALRPFCGSRIKLQTIDFSDFERRFLNSP